MAPQALRMETVVQSPAVSRSASTCLFSLLAFWPIQLLTFQTATLYRCLAPHAHNPSIIVRDRSEVRFTAESVQYQLLPRRSERN